MENLPGWLAIGFVMIVVLVMGMGIGWYVSKHHTKSAPTIQYRGRSISPHAIATHIFQELEPKIW